MSQRATPETPASARTQDSRASQSNSRSAREGSGTPPPEGKMPFSDSPQVQRLTDLTEMANRGSQVQRLTDLTEMANRSSQVQQAAGLRALVKGGTANAQPSLQRDGAPAQVQREEDPASIHVAAQSGVKGQGGPLPYFDQIQKAFGPHDISHIRAYSDANAASANQTMGAQAYAMGNKVAFSGTPSLHTSAHEAAHVVQQQARIQLKDGIGQLDDPYEQQADAVADAVVRGHSAAPLLSQYTPGGAQTSSSGGDHELVQGIFKARKFGAKKKKLDEQDPLEEAPDDLIDISFSEIIAKTKISEVRQSSYLSLLEQSPSLFIFDLDKDGKIPEKVLNLQIKKYIDQDNTFREANANIWSFTIKNFQKGGWIIVSDAPGIRAKTDKDGNAHVKIDRVHFKHMTHQLQYAFEQANEKNDYVKKEDAMNFDSGLVYKHILGPQEDLVELGVLGGAVLSVTPTVKGAPAATKVKYKIMGKWRVIEPSQDDPRHIGTHSGYDMGADPHFHLVKAGGGLWDKEDIDEIIRMMDECYLTVEEPQSSWAVRKQNSPAQKGAGPLKQQDKAALDEFLAAKDVEGHDLDAQREIQLLVDNTAKKSSKTPSKRPVLASKEDLEIAWLWRTTQGWLRWKK